MYMYFVSYITGNNLTNDRLINPFGTTGTPVSLIKKLNFCSRYLINTYCFCIVMKL